MLPKKNRLPRRLFTDIIRSRNIFNSTHFTLRVIKGSHTRIAASISKKISKSAVKRNAVRRRVYAALAEHLAEIKPGAYLFAAKNGAAELRGDELLREIQSLLKASERV